MSLSQRDRAAGSKVERAGANGRGRIQSATGPLVIACVAWLAVVSTLGPGPRGPGLTCDEYYYCALGKRFVHAAVSEGWRLFTFENIDQNFGPARRQPPLGLWLLGLFHAPFDSAFNETELIWMPAARLAPATGFAATVFLVGLLAGGKAAGTVASLALAISPRAFAHAHFAALDTLAVLFCVAAIVAVYWAANSRAEKCWRRFTLAGICWGLALLTKINGLVLLFPIAIWLTWVLGRRAAGLFLIWAFAAAATFLIGWPWLWPAPWRRLAEYLSTATSRLELHNYYLGHVWRDIDTPWHYPWVMTAVTIPAGLILLGVVGLATGWQNGPRRKLLALVALNLLAQLVLFSLPGVHVYDGARLFLIVYALWAVLAGLGANACLGYFENRRIPHWLLIAGAIAFLAGQSFGAVRYHPFQLSYYNLFAGGLDGAARRGFEVCYWGDAVDAGLLAKAADVGAGKQVLFAPSLAPWQVPAVAATSADLALRQVELIAYEPQKVEANRAVPGRLAIVYHRRAEQAQWEALAAGGRVLAENSRAGVWLARLYQLPENRSVTRDTSPAARNRQARP